MWILETSTDPMVVTAAAELAIDLQWPLDLDLTSAWMCLRENFHSCFDLNLNWVVKLRSDMAGRAINCGRALCSLTNVAQASGQRPRLLWFHDLVEHNVDIDPHHWTQLSIVIQFLKRQPDMIEIGDSISSDNWALHTSASLAHRHITSGQKGLDHFLDTLHVDKIVGLDESTFADYLCCINSFLGPISPKVLVEVDKRSVVWFQQQLVD
jgi:hypothetical protein